MSDKTIKKYIYLFSANKLVQMVSCEKLNQYVSFATICPDVAINGVELPKYQIYFILNVNLQCVGAILDMYEDLHWYVLPKYRKQSVLVNALQNVVIPHIFKKDNNRKNQRLSISRGIGTIKYKASQSIARKVGFNLEVFEDYTIGTLSRREIYQNS